MSTRARLTALIFTFLALLVPAGAATADPPDRFDFSLTVTSQCDLRTVFIEGEATSDNKFQNGAYWQRYNLIGMAYSPGKDPRDYVFHYQENYREKGAGVSFSSSFRLISKGSSPNLLIKYKYNQDGIQFDGEARCVG